MKKLMILLMLTSWGLGNAQDDFYTSMVEHFMAKKPLPLNFNGNMSEAMEIQDRLVKALEMDWGPVVGYKAALTTTSTQQRFKVDHPIRGSLLKNMMFPSGSTLPTKFGTYTFFEGDLIFRVGDGEAIMKAQGGEELLAALDAVIPFVEVPDLVYAGGNSLTGPAIAAINAGARGGVYGEAIPIPRDGNILKALKKIRIELLDERDEIIGYGYAFLILEHPINAVLFIRDSLKQQGRKLKTGDLLSLGSITQLIPVTREGTLTARYYNIFSDKSHDVVVHFKNQ